MDTLERLLVTIEGSSELLRQELRKGGVDVQSFARNTDQQLGKVNSGLTKMASTLRTALASFGVGVSVAGLVNFARNAINVADAVGESARQAGFGAERFQRLQFVFGQNGVAASEFESAMRAANTRLGQFLTTGAGPAASAIEQLGLKQRIASGEIRTGEQFVDAIIESLNGVPSSAERAALAAAIFGREAGPKLAETLAKGKTAIDEAASKFNGFTDEQVKRADALNDAYERLATTLGVKLKGTLIELATLGGAALGIDELAGVGRGPQDRIRELESQLQFLTGERPGTSLRGEDLQRRRAAVEAEIRALKEYERLINTPFIQPRTAAAPQDGLQEVSTSFGRLPAGMRRFDFAGARRAVEQSALQEVSGAPVRMPSEIRQFSEEFKRSARNINEMAEATEKARERQERLADAIAASFESRGMEALLNGNIREGIRGFAKDLLELVIRMTILQPIAEKLAKTLSNMGKGKGDKKDQSGLIDIFGGLFSGMGFAGGGRPPVGKASIVGENGPELWVPDVPGRIFTAAQTRMATAGGAVIEQHFHVQAGLPPQWESQLRGVTQIAATAAFDAVSSRLGGRR